MSFFTTFIPNLDQLDLNTQRLNKSLKDKINRNWQDTFDQPTLMKVYSSLIKELRLFRQGKSQPEKLYYFLKLFSSSDYKVIFDQKYHHALLLHTELLKSEIEQLLLEKNTQLIKNTTPAEQGDLREMVSFLIGLYSKHPSYHSEGYDELKSIGGNLVFNFLDSYPYQDTCDSIIRLLPLASNALEKYTQLLNDIVCGKQNDDRRDLLLYILLSETIGLYTQKSDFFYKKSKAVLKLLSKHIALWSDEQLDYFITQGVLKVYGIYPNTKAKIAEIMEYINKLHEGDFSPEVIKKRVKEYNLEIVNIESNPNTFIDQCYNSTAKSLMVKSNTIAFLQRLSKLAPSSQAKTQLNQLIERTLAIKNTPKVFPINKTAKIKFSDLHFKLLVIEDLMYNKGLLTPKFDLNQFVAEYHQREIDKEQEGDSVIPEVLAYFKGLDISEELLKKVTSLTQDCGVDGGADIYAQLWPFWDPGCGDEVLKISNKALKDLALLPNLKKIIGLEHSIPSKKLINGFKEHQIQLIEQEF
ncbi:hypothetical protein GCM10009111_34450 [Colwellia asteriadis]|uniref:DUF6892 domain-containing protein n=1 Tax=Colwellia asteriadis TaxID=517723 RepID=A0ABP3WKV5_9GAMM